MVIQVLVIIIQRTAISNGNDVYAYLYGYYSGYGLTIRCTSNRDVN